jgi:hypothetical protein
VFSRLTLVFWVSAGLVSACDCLTISPKAAKHEADIVFRGTVTALHDTGKGYPIAVFRVSRVSKGNVPETFEMPALQEDSWCLGFLPRVTLGAEFLVYAHHLDPSDPDYLPLPCQTVLARNARTFESLDRAANLH